jgi:hypothetical protein
MPCAYKHAFVSNQVVFGLEEDVDNAEPFSAYYSWFGTSLRAKMS